MYLKKIILTKPCVSINAVTAARALVRTRFFGALLRQYLLP